MKLCYLLWENIFRQIFCDEYSSERMSDYHQFLVIQVRKKFLEPDFPCRIKSIFSTRHFWSERFKSIRKPFGEPLFPTRVFFIRIIFCITEILEIYLFILESFSSSDEDYLGFLWSHILRDKEILLPWIKNSINNYKEAKQIIESIPKVNHNHLVNVIVSPYQR